MQTFAKVVGVILLLAGIVLLGTWILMLVLGAVHTVFVAVPALSFGKSFIINMALGILGNVFGGRK